MHLSRKLHNGILNKIVCRLLAEPLTAPDRKAFQVFTAESQGTKLAGTAGQYLYRSGPDPEEEVKGKQAGAAAKDP